MVTADPELPCVYMACLRTNVYFRCTRYLAARGYANGRNREGSASGPHSDDDAASDDEGEDSLASPPHQNTTE